MYIKYSKIQTSHIRKNQKSKSIKTLYMAKYIEDIQIKVKLGFRSSMVDVAGTDLHMTEHLVTHYYKNNF